MFRVLFWRFSRRRAVSTIICGLIILTLILTALATMVLVSRQYDQYQQQVNQMAQYQDQGLSESLVANYPGLTLVTSSSVPGWGSGCTTTYNCYNMTVSNAGGIGLQIVRIYINSTAAGCNLPCVLTPTSTIASYAFNQANQFLNTGELNHVVMLALPITVKLPVLYYRQNTVFVVTSRGNVFSFQWPFPVQILGGQSQSAFSSGIIKIAYQDILDHNVLQGSDLCTAPTGGNPPNSGTYSGCDSSHDYYGVNTSPWPSAPYCHNELEALDSETYLAPTNYAEEITGINYAGVSNYGNAQNGGTLYFLNPWITLPILEDARTDASSNPPTTQIYIYINITNTGGTPYTVAGGTIDLTVAGSTHIDGILIGIYYNATGNSPSSNQWWFPASSTQTQTVAVGKSFYAIFKVTQIMLDLSYLGSASMFWGSLSLTNGIEGTGFVGGTGLSSGLWMRMSC